LTTKTGSGGPAKGFGPLLLLGAVCAAIALAAIGAAGAAAGGSISTFTGTFDDGAAYLIEAPDDWNGTLLLYSHGYVVPGSPNPARDVGDPLTRQWLLDRGYALAGSSYATTGWAIEQAIPDQIETLDTFASLVRPPDRTIAWGHSLGGMVTAGLLQEHPDRFTAALPMCGVLAGGVGAWNEGLDSAYATQQLLGPGTGLQIVHISNPGGNLALAELLLYGAQSTPLGRARIALSAALGDVPGWFTPGSPEPAATDYDTQEANQFQWLTQVDAPFAFALRADLEARAHGNPSWNTGVNYEKQLENSIDFTEVKALYAEAGFDIDADLAQLDNSPRISAETGALEYLSDNVIFDGDLHSLPVLTLHTTGDGLVPNQNEQAYRSAVQAAKDVQLLREAFVHRAGHCTFTPAETISALQALVQRVDTGKWRTDPDTLDAAAAALGPVYNTASPAYISFDPTPFLRPYSG
jgi:pimeloyl-ACP methyl ester carboxylesterase